MPATAPTTAPATVCTAQRPATGRAVRTLSSRRQRVVGAASPLGGAARPPPAAPAGSLPDALRHELAVILADLAWALYRKEEHADAPDYGQP